MSEFSELRDYQKVNWHSLVDLLNDFSFDNQDAFEFEGLNFFIIHSEEGEEVMLSQSSVLGYDCDIYINPEINKEELKKRVFHEVVEFYLQRYYSNDSVTHEIAEKLTAKFYS